MTHTHTCPRCKETFQHRDSWDCDPSGPLAPYRSVMLCTGCWLATREKLETMLINSIKKEIEAL